MISPKSPVFRCLPAAVRTYFYSGLLVLALTAGCSSKGTSDKAEQPDFTVSCIAVLPAVSKPELDSELLSAIEKKELEDGIYFFNKSLKQYFISRKDVRLFSDGQLADTEKDADAPPLERARELAERLSCNAVLETTIRRYKERVGGRMTAKEPASVAFDYRLLAMPDGTVLCRDTFDAEQQSIMENLLGFRDGTGGSMSWLTAEEFLVQGLQNRLKKCSYLAEED
jgi:hypothetical protein